MTDKIILFWFRQDLRLSDNPGLFEAAKKGRITPIYILDDESPGRFKMGSASRWWLHHSLADLNKSLQGKLNIYVGSSREIILKISQENPIDEVYWNRGYTPWEIKNEEDIEAPLKALKIECQSFKASLLWEPGEILKKDKSFYKVYTPFYRKGCLQASPPRTPLPPPERLSLVKDGKNTTRLSDLNLLSVKKEDQSLGSFWEVGEKAAHQKLEDFLEQGLRGYKEGRNYPSQSHTSRLSPHLHFGEISPNQVWYGAQIHGLNGGLDGDTDSFLSELGWREFSSYLLYHFPELPHQNFQEKFDGFPWEKNRALLEAWQKGQTGYPLVDAGMRELWQTGYMHNRLRMIVGSFLVKNLLLDWRHGEAWFWGRLVDADLANNSASWQWIAGSGADAAPYFRIFNPILQGEKFDPQGDYTRRFVPELSQLPNQYLFKPWKAPPDVLKAAGVVLGETYPNPIVTLERSRGRALEAYRHLSKNRNL